MSFDLVVWKVGRPLDEVEAGVLYERAMSGEVKDLSPSKALSSVYRSLTSRFPDADGGDSGALTDRYLEYYRQSRLLVVSLGWGEIAEVAPIVVSEAHQAGLSVYDPQGERHITAEDGDPGDWANIQARGPTLDPTAWEQFVRGLDEIDDMIEADEGERNRR